jgi:hypothetical protein
MVPTIHIDDRVLAELKRRGNDRNPNEVIRELLGLPVKARQVPQPGVYLVPHAQGEFDSVQELRDFLSVQLKARGGQYLVASVHYWRNVIPGSICLFQKNKEIIGEGTLATELQPYKGTEVSPATGRHYEGCLQFDRTSILVYPRSIPFEEAQKLISKTLTWRGVQKLTMEDYLRISKAAHGYPVLMP